MIELGTVVELKTDPTFYGVVLRHSDAELGNTTLVRWTSKTSPEMSYLWWNDEDQLEIVDPKD